MKTTRFTLIAVGPLIPGITQTMKRAVSVDAGTTVTYMGVDRVGAFIESFVKEPYIYTNKKRWFGVVIMTTQ
jgi:hypothetical protein